ncbi:Hypothetical predicted protein [Paramuricea clavata]|uniref:Uncharacterized protein n=1 Tax=Paramuricea clavata TaxID=317549 RepID=A0A6S7H5E1_PARCT|nr:Hypothetical predicted protein [Paramuricea clavata]
MSANLRLSWAGDFDRLKEFVKSDLELQGSWSSPANEKKLFVSDNVELLWWKNKKFLKINGEDANRIKRCMINAMFTSLNLDSIKSGVDMATNTENSLNENQPTKHQCTGCECSKLSPDLEGWKLDLVVLESKLNHKIQAVENQILRMNDCRPKEPKNHANLENMLTTSTPISSGGTNKTKEVSNSNPHINPVVVRTANDACFTPIKVPDNTETFMAIDQSCEKTSHHDLVPLPKSINHSQEELTLTKVVFPVRNNSEQSKIGELSHTGSRTNPIQKEQSCHYNVPGRQSCSSYLHDRGQQFRSIPVRITHRPLPVNPEKVNKHRRAYRSQVFRHRHQTDWLRHLELVRKVIRS